MTDRKAARGGAAILLPGAGSSADFVRRAFAGVVGNREVRVLTQPAGDSLGLAEMIDATVAELSAGGWSTEVVAGVSLGAHAAATWAARSQTRDVDLLLVMPAWTGSPGVIAAATAAAAQRLEDAGVAAELARIRRESPEDWVVAELMRAWPRWSEVELVAALRATAESPAPTDADLARILARTGIVGLRSDPLHPHQTAAHWSAAIPLSGLAILDRTAPAGDVAILGRAAAAAAAGQAMPSRLASGSR